MYEETLCDLLPYILFIVPKISKGYKEKQHPIHLLTQNYSHNTAHVHRWHADESESHQGFFPWTLWEPRDSAKPSQCDQYRANNPPMWFLLLCGCCEYFRITRWSIPEGRLVNDVEPLLHRQSTERWAESDFRTFLSLKTWAVSIKSLSPKGTSEEAVSKKKKQTSRILWLYRGQDMGICTWGKSERRETLRLRRGNNIAAGHGWAAEGFFLRKEPKVKAELSLRSCHSQYASLISTCPDLCTMLCVKDVGRRICPR